MKKLVPSTLGYVTITIKRQIGEKALPKKRAKLASAREAVNAKIAEWDTTDNPVVAVAIHFEVPEGGVMYE